jgi:hypothetical protein
VLLWRRDREIINHNISILDDMIEFLFGLDVEMKEVSIIGDLFQPFLRKYIVGCRNIKKITKLLSQDFYDGKFIPARMSLAIEIIKVHIHSNT